MKPFIPALASIAICLGSPAYAGTRTVTLSVPGMSCAACPITVKKALERVDGVEQVTVAYKTKEAKVRFDPEKTTVDGLLEATANAGYPSRVKQNTPAERRS